jgi:hypothetical protein
MHHIRRQFVQQSHKIHNLVINEAKNAEVHAFKNYFGSTSARHIPDNTPEEVSQIDIVPSLSENDMGSWAFKNSSWRKNENWRSQLETTSFRPNSSYLGRGLFGNLVLDVQQDHRALNPIMYHTGGTKHYRIHDTR